MRQLLAGLSWCIVLVYPFIVLFGLQLLPMRLLGLMLIVLAGLRILLLRSQVSKNGLPILLSTLLVLIAAHAMIANNPRRAALLSAGCKYGNARNVRCVTALGPAGCRAAGAHVRTGAPRRRRCLYPQGHYRVVSVLYRQWVYRLVHSCVCQFRYLGAVQWCHCLCADWRYVHNRMVDSSQIKAGR